MSNITIVLADNQIVIAGKTYSCNNTLKALNVGEVVTIDSNVNGRTLVKSNYQNFRDADGNAYGPFAEDFVAEFNAYASIGNPENYGSSTSTDTGEVELLMIFLEQ